MHPVALGCKFTTTCASKGYRLLLECGYYSGCGYTRTHMAKIINSLNSDIYVHEKKFKDDQQCDGCMLKCEWY